MRRELGGIAYDDRAALYVGADYPEGGDFHTEVLLIDPELPEADPYLAGPSDRELEARCIAGEIQRLLAGQQVMDKESGTMRPARYRDMVILTRSIQGTAEVFATVLAREGIPAHVGTREGYFSAQEVSLVLDYLQVLLNRQQDIPLTAVLASPIGGLDSEELAKIRCAWPKIPFHRAAELYRSEGEDAGIREKVENCLGTMDRLRQKVPYTPMHELLRMVLEDTGTGIMRQPCRGAPSGEPTWKCWWRRPVRSRPPAIKVCSILSGISGSWRNMTWITEKQIWRTSNPMQSGS